MSDAGPATDYYLRAMEFAFRAGYAARCDDPNNTRTAEVIDIVVNDFRRGAAMHYLRESFTTTVRTNLADVGRTINEAEAIIGHGVQRLALVSAVYELGREYGPLGVALVAARLTDPAVLLARLTNVTEDTDPSLTADKVHLSAVRTDQTPNQKDPGPISYVASDGVKKPFSPPEFKWPERYTGGGLFGTADESAQPDPPVRAAQRIQEIGELVQTLIEDDAETNHRSVSPLCGHGRHELCALAGERTDMCRCDCHQDRAGCRTEPCEHCGWTGVWHAEGCPNKSAEQHQRPAGSVWNWVCPPQSGCPCATDRYAQCKYPQVMPYE